jgi:hypothetical protein
MYRLFFILLVLGIIGWFAYENHFGKNEMKLINQKTGFVIVEFHNALTQINDPYLKKEMEIRGITVPPFLRKSFQGTNRVRLGDRDFQRAFKEIYYELNLDHEVYQWR